MSKKDKIEKALDVLGDEAREWWEYRRKNKYTHIVDAKTGKWVSQFEANGKTYYIRSPHQGIGPRRYTELDKRLAAVGFDATFADIARNVREALDAANTIGTKEPKLDVLFTRLANILEGMKRSDRKWEMAFEIAALFIVTKDEDITQWNDTLADEKIEDWNAAKIHEQDFFFLVMSWATLSKAWWDELPKKVGQIMAKYSPAT